MGAKFKKVNDEWLVELVTDATGSKAPEVGDIVRPKKGGSYVSITEIVETKGTPTTYGFTVLAKFKNH